MSSFIEIERKFLLKGKPDIFSNVQNGTVKLIREELVQQTYMVAPPGHDVQIRAMFIRELQGGTPAYEDSYWATLKQNSVTASRLEFEVETTYDHYRKLLSDKDPKRNVISKMRTPFQYKGRTFEVDEFFTNLTGLYVMEIELPSENAKFEIPDFLEIDREVTEESFYSNYNLALLNSLEIAV